MLATHHPVLSPLLSVEDPVFPLLPLSGVLALAHEQGWTPAGMASGLGVVAGPLPAQRISYLQARELWLQARYQAGTAMPLLSGARKALPALSHLADGMLAQPTLGDAIRFGLQYQMIAGAMVRLELNEQDGQDGLCEIRATAMFEDAELEDSLAADHLITAINAARQLVSGWRLLRVELRLQAGAAEGMYRDFFGCEVIFGADQNRVQMAAAGLNQPLPLSDPARVSRSRFLCEQELQSHCPAGDSLRTTLTALQCETMSLQQMAGRLQISVRTLHRLLAREGIAYAGLGERIRMERARELLAQGKTTEQIAEELGYAESRSLRRAFKRQTGMSPVAYRQSLTGASLTGNSNQKVVPVCGEVWK